MITYKRIEGALAIEGTYDEAIELLKDVRAYVLDFMQTADRDVVTANELEAAHERCEKYSELLRAKGIAI